MRLNDLLREIQYTRLVLPKDEVEVSGVNIDSRLVEAGGMFIAIKGTQADGHAYIPSAEEKGATAIVCENIPEKQSPNVAYIVVPDAQAVAGKLATTFYGNPSQKLRLVGVTGTNGKTTIAGAQVRTALYRMQLHRRRGIPIDPHHSGCHIP